MKIFEILMVILIIALNVAIIALVVSYVAERKHPTNYGKAHVLKTKGRHFNKVWNGFKQFEVRKGDREYKNNDIVVLKETAGTVNGMTFYTGRKITARIEYVFDISDCFDGLVAFSIDVIKKETGIPCFEKD